MWYSLRDHEQYVYHYTTAHVLTAHILLNKTIKFSSFDHLNDPREYKKFDLDSYWQGGVPDNISKISKEMEIALKAGWKIACFASDPIEAVIPQRADALSPDQLNRAHERGHSRPRMWAQYAANHTGACLVFHKQSLNVAIQTHANQNGLQVFYGRVSYSNTSVVPHLALGPFCFSGDEVQRYGLERAAKQHAERHLQELYLNKNRDWEGEREARWLLRGSNEGAEFVNFGDALAGIALGDKFPDELKPIVGRYTVKNGGDVVRMDWRRDIPQPKPLTLRMLLPEGDPDRPMSGW
jgi:hypothetical protein